MFYFCTWFQHVFVEGSRASLAGGRTAARFALCPLVDALLPSMLLSNGEGCPSLPRRPSGRPGGGGVGGAGGPGRAAALPPPPDEKELPHLGAGPERPGPLEKMKRKDPHREPSFFICPARAENGQRKLRRTPAQAGRGSFLPRTSQAEPVAKRKGAGQKLGAAVRTVCHGWYPPLGRGPKFSHYRDTMFSFPCHRRDVDGLLPFCGHLDCRSPAFLYFTVP